MKLAKFMDPRTFGYFRVAAFSPREAVGEPRKNADSILDMLRKLVAEEVDYAVGPELGITGYSCGDGFFSQVLIKGSEEELMRLVKETPKGIIATVGLPILYNSFLFNCVVNYTRNKILGIVPKSYLPNYREFYEKRHFVASENLPPLPSGCYINFAGQKNIPFGIDLLFVQADGLVKIHNSICEDDWVLIPQASFAILAGANISANSSASNFTIGKEEYRRNLMKMISGTGLCAKIYASAIDESSTDLSWDGQCMIAERGEILKEGELFHKGTYIISDIDVTSLVADRMMQGSFADNARHNQRIFRQIEFQSGYKCGENMTRKGFYRYVDPHPFVPSDPATLNKRCLQIFNSQASALMKKLSSLPARLRRVFIGLSGGSDSTLALLVAIHAFDKLNLPRHDIVCITMPGFGTTNDTKKNAVDLAKALGVTLRTIPIKKSCQVRFKQVGYDVEKAFAEGKTLPFENIQAWDRTDILFASACADGGIVLGTGDLSELVLGWCTFKGDHMSHYAINCGVPKTLVIHLIKWAADNIFGEKPKVKKPLLLIVATPITPGLLPAKDGQIVQKSEGINGPYELHDFFTKWFERFGFEPVHIARLCLEAYKNKYELVEIKKWMKVFLLRFFSSQFKRNCVPDGPKVGAISVSPRGDLRLPSDMDCSAFMRNWEEIPDEID